MKNQETARQSQKGRDVAAIEILRGSAQLFPDPVRRVRWLLKKAHGFARRRNWGWAYRFARKAAFWTGEYEMPPALMRKAVTTANRYAGIQNKREPGSAPVTFAWRKDRP